MPALVPVATSAEGCASGDCLPEAAAEEAELASTQALPAVERWKQSVDAVRLANPRIGKSLTFARLIALTNGEAQVAFPTDAGFHRATVFGHARAEIEKHVSKQLGAPTKLVEVKSDQAFTAAAPSVAEKEANDKASRERDIELKVRANPAVLSVLKILGGNLEHVQVLEPASRNAEESPPGTEEEPS